MKYQRSRTSILNHNSLRVTSTFATILMLSAAPAMADTQRANHLAKGTMISPTQAWTYYGNATTHTNTVNTSNQTPNDIKALAKGLGSERTDLTADQYAQKVYDYVRNNIDTEFRFELGKGGRMAWIDLSGTSFDQADLMVQLLKEKNISTQFKVGTITLSASQFGKWTGLVTGLNEANQNFVVNAKAACQLLADGGIPGTVNGASDCNAISGNLNSVTMGHAWVYANSKSYDPTFKQHRLIQGIDIVDAAGCGTETSSTCGNQVTAQALSGATLSSVAGNPTVQNLNETALNNKLNGLALAVENKIKATDPEARIEKITGGRKRDISYNPTPAAPLPYTSSTQYSWAGEVPNQHRVKLRFRYMAMDETFYLDELDVSGIAGGFQTPLYIGGEVIAPAPPCGYSYQNPPASCGLYSNDSGQAADWILDIDHPYPQASLADESIRQAARYLERFSVIVSAGEAASSRQFHAGQFAKQLNKKAPPELISISNNTAGKVSSHAESATEVLTRQSTASRMVVDSFSTNLTRHHRAFFTDGKYVSTTGASSLIPASYSSIDQESMFQLVGAIDAIAEDNLANLMLRYNTASLFNHANEENIKFVGLSPTTTSAALGSLIDYNSSDKNNIQQSANRGFSIILPIDADWPCKVSINESGTYTTACPLNDGEPAFIYKSDGGAHLVGHRYKSADNFRSPEPSTERADYNRRQKKYVQIDEGNGTFVLRPPEDISTGVGNFPARLSFSRTFDSGRRPYEISSQVQSFGGLTSNSRWYDVSGSNFMHNVPHIGGGWTHNYQSIAYVGSDHNLSFGQNSALHGSAMLAGILTLRDQYKTGNFHNMLSSVFVMNWMAEQIFQNSVTVEPSPQSSEKFLKLPSGSYSGSTFSPSKLSLAGTFYGPKPLEQSPYGFIGQYGYNNLSINYTDGSGSKLNFGVTPWGTNATLKEWVDPSGIKMTPSWVSQSAAEGGTPIVWDAGMLGVLTGVSNNLGRSLTFESERPYLHPSGPGTGQPGIPNPQTYDPRRKLDRVLDENGRAVDFSRNDCSSFSRTIILPGGTPYSVGKHSSSYLCDTLEVTLPDQTKWKYTYEAGPDSPDSDTDILGPTALRRVYTSGDLQNPFQVFNYDELYRVTNVTDSKGRIAHYYPNSVAGEEWKAGDIIDPFGNMASTQYDAQNSVIASTDPLGRTSQKLYNDNGQLLREIMPEGNATEYTYDVRGNKLTSCTIAKGRVTWASLANPETPQCSSAAGDLLTQTTYVGGPTVQPDQCSSLKTCNKPSYIIDPKGNRTTMTWSSTHGGILTQKSGLTSSGSCGIVGSECPEMTYTYSSFSGTGGSIFYLPTSIVEKIDATRSVTTRFEYNASNKYVLKSKIVEGNGQSLRTCYEFDASGNLVSMTSPKGTGGSCS